MVSGTGEAKIGRLVHFEAFHQSQDIGVAPRLRRRGQMSCSGSCRISPNGTGIMQLGVTLPSGRM